MKKIIFIICLNMGLGLCAQTVTVKDKTSLQPIEDVKVNDKQTNERGQVELSTVAVDKLNMLYRFSKPGYFSDSLSAEKLKEQNYIVYLSERAHDWSGIVVSASRFEEKSTDVAQQNLVISRREMQFMNQPTTAELIQQSGRAFVQKSQMGGGSITMRGFEANKVLLVIDGVRMNNAVYRGGHLQNVLSVDNNMLDRTELLFGPGSVIYGSDALGGVIHFYTRNPVLSRSNKTLFKAMAFTRYGTAMSEKTGHFDFNIGFRKFAFLSSATISDFGDARIGKKPVKGYESWGRRPFYTARFGNKDSMVLNSDSFNQIPTAYRQWDLMQKIMYRQNIYITHLLNLQHSNTTDFPRYDRLTELGPNGKPTQAQWYYGPQTRTLASYKLSYDKKNLVSDNVILILAYQNLKESRHNRGFGSSNLTHRNEEIRVLSLNLDMQKEISSKTELRYGAELTHNKVKSLAERENIENGLRTSQSTRYPDGGSVMSSAAIYMTQNTYFSEQLILNAGIRFTTVHLKSVFSDKTFFPFLPNSIEQNNQNTSGNIGLVYLGKKDLKISATIASGFRAANVDDMAKVFESAGGRIIIPNSSVRPEQTTNLDFNLNKTFLKKLNLEINGYYTRFSNALTVGRAQLNGKDTISFQGVNSTIYTTQNALEAFLYGGFAGFSYDVNKAFSVSGSVSYTYGRIKTDTGNYPLDHISPVFGRFGFIYKHKKYKAEFFTLFNGAKKSEDYNLMGEDNQIYSADPVNGFTPAWYTLNLRAHYQLNNFIQLQMALENILDQHYRSFSSGYSAPGRNLMLTLRGNF